MGRAPNIGKPKSWLNPWSFASSSLGPDLALSPRTLPLLMSGIVVKERQADTKVKSKDKTFIKRIIKTLTKLFFVPEKKRGQVQNS